jgi:hypothetical protein
MIDITHPDAPSSNPIMLLELVEDGDSISVNTSLFIDGVGRWAWTVAQGQVHVKTVYESPSHQTHELTLIGNTTVITYRIGSDGAVIYSKTYHAKERMH